MGQSIQKIGFTFELLTNYDGSYKGHPTVIGKRKNPRAANKKPALYRRTVCNGQSRYVKYHSNASAWMTTEIF